MSELPCSGAILEVDLGARTATRRPTPAALVEDYLGGRGLGARILWDLPAGTPAGSPANPLVFCPGLLNAYPAPAKSRCALVTKSPATRPLRPRSEASSGITFSNAGGAFGPALKQAGLDALVVRGEAAGPTVLVVDGDRVRFEDATDLAGLSSSATDAALAARLPGFQTAYVGPAGEAGVRFAAIMHEVSRAFARGGAGWVMGRKRLKALAVRGDVMPGVADRAGYAASLEELRQHFRDQRETTPYRNRRRCGSLTSLSWVSGMGALAVRNFREGTFGPYRDFHERTAPLLVHRYSCYACPVACRHAAAVSSGPYPGRYGEASHFEHAGMLGACCGISDENLLPRLIEACNEAGLDIISMANVLAFLMDATARGALPAAALDGARLELGDHAGMLELIERTASRSGVGDLLSQGVRAAAAALGGRAETYAFHSKGLEYAAWNPKGFAPMAISYVTSTRGACHLFGQAAGGQSAQAMLDSAGDCFLVRNFTERAMLARLVAAVVGRSYDEGSLFRLGARVVTLEKCFNWREGFAREDDRAVPACLEREPTARAEERFSEAWLDSALDAYYRVRGWDPRTSKPTPGTLASLGLGFTLPQMGEP